jgi:hypothetical protein
VDAELAQWLGEACAEHPEASAATAETGRVASFLRQPLAEIAEGAAGVASSPHSGGAQQSVLHEAEFVRCVPHVPRLSSTTP